MTYKPDGNNPKSEMKKRVDRAIAVFESAYTNGNSVIVGNVTSDCVVIITPDAIPYFREAFCRVLK